MTDAQARLEALEPDLSDRQGFNRRWYAGNPDLEVFRPTTPDEAVESFQKVLDARPDSGEVVQVTCGRHCYEGFVYNDDTRFIIDVTGLRAYGVTPPGGLWVDVGFGNWDMYRTANNVAQRTLPAGSCYSVGLGGHITGGGYGLLSRLYGLTIDYLSAVDIVIDVEGTAVLLHATEDGEFSDLLWGIKGGGGGQFGLITRYYFSNVPPSPDRMFTFNLTWDWATQDGSLLTQSAFDRIVGLFQETFCRQEEDTWHIWAMLHLNHKDAQSISIPVFVYFLSDLHGDRTAFEAGLRKRIRACRQAADKIAPLSTNDYRLHGHPYVHSTRGMNAGGEATDFRHYTYLEGTQNFNSSGPNRFGKYKSAYLRKTWTDTMLQAAYRYLTAPVFDRTGNPVDMSQSLIQVDSYGGKINRVPPSATAIPQRSSIMKLQYQSYWDSNARVGSDDAALAAAHLEWINDLYTAVYAETGGTPDPAQDPSGNVDGCYYNYPDLDLGYDGSPHRPLSFALALYFGGNLTRLTAVKTKYNPKGWFGNRQSVKADRSQA